MIAYDDFLRVDVRAGTVLSAEPLAGARKPAYALRIDFGEEIGERRSSAQITGRYTAAELVGTQVCAVVNFPPKRIAGFESEVLVLGMDDEDGNVILVRPTYRVPNGRRLY
ncbi:MAG TPA: tRNA-binding protein [Candidatus Limnocylindrales bacterium]|nr:tRNA-binding protein [Candidatus Limnocylindrales bacterium]